MIENVYERITNLLNTCLRVPLNSLNDYPQLLECFETNNIKLNSISYSNEIFQPKDLKLIIEVISFFSKNQNIQNFSDFFSILTQEDPQIQKTIKSFLKLWILLIKAQQNYQDKQKQSQDIQMNNTKKSETVEEDDKVKFDINFERNNEEIQKFLDHINKAFIDNKNPQPNPKINQEDFLNYLQISDFQDQEQIELYQQRESQYDYEDLQKFQQSNCWTQE
ncbi:unnamed protein product [Paramecium pentaurelia]|uniref:Uncharacterized protein n=1 Tax=Paramecium pentaurelia TaxID=43138 RepID=A0A8S1UNZ7_9CILI|nr:unnamed protein product [Paramecium pentaurelia]